MKSGRLGTPDTVAHIPPRLSTNWRAIKVPRGYGSMESRWIVIDTEYRRQHVAHYALLPDTWRKWLLVFQMCIEV